MRNQWSQLGLLAFVAFAIALPSVSVAERDVFRCVHGDGRVEFRGTPLHGVDCAFVGRWQTDEPTNPAAGFGGQESAAPAEGVEAVDEGPWIRNCEVARDNVTLLESDGPVVETGADGRPVLLSDSDRAERLSQARRDVEYWCNPRR